MPRISNIQSKTSLKCNSLQIIFGRVQRRLKFLFAATLPLFILTLLALEINAQPQKPASIMDMVTVSENATIFIVDGENKGLFYYKLTEGDKRLIATTAPDHSVSISLDSFQQISLSEEIKKPNALAYKRGKLFICEKSEDSAAVYTLDLKSTDLASPEPKPVVKLFGSPDLRKPQSIAVSGSGLIAVADEELNDFVLFEPDHDFPNEQRYKVKKAGFPLPKSDQPGEFDKPIRINFTGNRLLMFDSNSNKFSLLNGSSSQGDQEFLLSLNKVISKIKDETKSAIDIAVINDIYYVAGERNITTFAPKTSYEKFPMLEKKNTGAEEFDSRSLITAGRDYLFVDQKDKRRVRVFPRPIPVSVNFELVPTSEDESAEKTLKNNLVSQRNALLALYEYLTANKLLPLREIRTKTDYDGNIKSLFLDEGVLFERPLPSDWFSLDNEQSYLIRLERFFCQLNSQASPSLCNEKNRLIDPIKKNQSLMLPGIIEFEVGTTRSKVNLGNRTVREHLKSRLIRSQLQNDGSPADHIFDINRELNTLEKAILNFSLLPAAQLSPNLKPGTLITFKNGKEEIIGDWSKCVEHFDENLKRKNIELNYDFLSDRVDTFLPKRDDRRDDDLFFNKLNINQVNIRLKSTEIESAELGIFEEARQKANVGVGCSVPSTDQGVFLINSALRGDGASFKLLKGMSERKLTQTELEKANLLANMSPDKDFSLTTEIPLYVGYTLLRVNLDRNVAEWNSVKEIKEVRPNFKQYILNETDKEILLPATRWRLGLFLYPREVYEGHNLSELRAAAGVSILSEEDLSLQNKSVNTSLITVIKQDDLIDKEIKDNRDKLYNLIKNFPVDARIKNVFIGIGESKIHPDHPDFEDVWYKPQDPKNPSGLWVPVSTPSPNPVRKKMDFDIASDHGDHVAGLIASRETAPLPGLVPGVKLFLIDTSSSAEAFLEKQINIAASKPKLDIFNFSFTLLDELNEDDFPKVKSYRNLKTKMNGDWADKLFIVAAGNDGQRLENTDIFPIAWAATIPNLIGVGATDGDGNILAEEWQCSSTKSCSGTNIGKQYVHIVAPGYQLFSTVRNGYAQASGTSQAVPLVSAAAAMLNAQEVPGVLLIKTRLIYTTDWLNAFDGKVWGGRLNFRRAVMSPFQNILVFNNKKTDTYAVRFKNAPDLKITNRLVGENSVCKFSPREVSATFRCPESIPFKDILRIHRVTNGNGQEVFRVIYLDTIENKAYLRIITNVEFESAVIPCDDLSIWNEKEFKQETCMDLPVNDIFDYTSKVPSLPPGVPIIF